MVQSVDGVAFLSGRGGWLWLCGRGLCVGSRSRGVLGAVVAVAAAVGGASGLGWGSWVVLAGLLQEDGKAVAAGGAAGTGLGRGHELFEGLEVQAADRLLELGFGEAEAVASDRRPVGSDRLGTLKQPLVGHACHGTAPKKRS